MLNVTSSELHSKARAQDKGSSVGLGAVLTK